MRMQINLVSDKTPNLFVFLQALIPTHMETLKMTKSYLEF